MAEDAEVTTTRPNGDTVRIGIGTKSLGLTTTQLPLIAALILLGFFVYFLGVNIAARIDVLRGEIQAQNQLLNQQTLQLVTGIHEQTKELTANQVRQNDLLRNYIEKIDQWFRALQQTSSDTLDKVRSWLEVLLYNQQHPESPRPLGMPPREERPGDKR